MRIVGIVFAVWFALVQSQCHPDPYEPNNTPADAARIDLPINRVLLNFCGNDTDDWFNVTSQNTGHLAVTAYAVYDSSMVFYITIIQPSLNVTFQDQEQYLGGTALRINVTANWYLVRIQLGSLSMNTTYRLSIAWGSGPTCFRDALEPNDAIPSATVIPAGGASYSNLSLCSGVPPDVDSFVFKIGGDNTSVLIQVRWEDNDTLWSQIQLVLLEADGSTIIDSQDLSYNQSHTMHHRLDASTYYLMVNNMLGEEWDIVPYSLSIEWEHVPVEKGQDLALPSSPDLGIALGVGLGLGVPLVMIVIVGGLLMVRRRRSQKRATLRNASFHLSTSDLTKIFEINYKQLKDLEAIGKGSFGMVYKAKWRETLVAVKMLHEDLAADEKAFQDFKSEAKLLSMLRPHPNVVLLLGITVPPGPLCIITEFCAGGSLESVLSSDAPISIEQQKKWCFGIAKGILHLHEEGIIHRDLAVRNVLLTENLEVKVADFGLSRHITDTTQVSKTVSVVGPLKWMPPEAIKEKVYSVHSDMWAYGVTVWEIVSREEPWSDMDAVKAAMAVCYENLRLAIPQECDPCLREMMTRCWQVDPQSRPSFKEVCQELSGQVPQMMKTYSSRESTSQYEVAPDHYSKIEMQRQGDDVNV